MPSFEIFDALDAPEIIEVFDKLQIDVGDAVKGPEIIEILQGPRGFQGPPGVGTIQSINGQTGPFVVLTAADVSALAVDELIDGGTY